MTAAIAVGILVAAGTYLILQRGLVRITLGFVLLGHAANVLLVASGVMDLRGAPLIGERAARTMADPLPQAFVLTAIVITFGITVYLLALARASGDAASGDGASGDPAPDDPASGDPTAGDPAAGDGGSGDSETGEADTDADSAAAREEPR